ncbi:MAG: hypothetical protein ACTSVZ_08065 [Promethearchaeota archaeon]
MSLSLVVISFPITALIRSKIRELHALKKSIEYENEKLFSSKHEEEQKAQARLLQNHQKTIDNLNVKADQGENPNGQE